MVLIIQRLIQRVIPGKWDALNEIDPKFNEIEKKYGFPDNKRRLRPVTGSLDMNTVIIEYQWPSMGKLERAMTKALLDPEHQKLSVELEKIISHQIMEIYTPVIDLKDLKTD